MTTYTTPTKVSALIGIIISESSQPSISTVEDFILRAEEYIDSRTRSTFLNSKTITDEYYQLTPDDYTAHRWIGRLYSHFLGCQIPLNTRPLLTMSHALGDKFEVWNGSVWEDWLVSRVEGRANDYWINYGEAIIYMMTPPSLWGKDVLRFTYRAGRSTVPKDIEQAATYLASIDVLENYQGIIQLIGGGTEVESIDKRIERMSERVEKILSRYTVARGFFA